MPAHGSRITFHPLLTCAQPRNKLLDRRFLIVRRQLQRLFGKLSCIVNLAGALQRLGNVERVLIVGWFQRNERLGNLHDHAVILLGVVEIAQILERLQILRHHLADRFVLGDHLVTLSLRLIDLGGDGAQLLDVRRLFGGE